VQGCFCGKRFDCCAVRFKPQVFLLSLRIFSEKMKISGRKLGAIEGNTLA